MAFSSSEGKEFFKEWLGFFGKEFDGNPPIIKTVLDVGAGAGAYGDLIRGVNPDIHVTGIEPFYPYTKRFDLDSRYDTVYVQDIEYFLIKSVKNYDLVIFGDVLEHLPLEDALAVIQEIKKRCKFLYISIPLWANDSWFLGYRQLEDEWKENPKEEHQFEISLTMFKGIFGPFVWTVPYRQVVVFIAEGDLI